MQLKLFLILSTYLCEESIKDLLTLVGLCSISLSIEAWSHLFSLQNEIFVFKPVHLSALSLRGSLLFLTSFNHEFSWINISHILKDSSTEVEEEQVVTKNLNSHTWKSEWATAQRFTGHERRWGLVSPLSELCRVRAAFSSLGASAQTSKSAWVLPAQHSGTGKHLAWLKAEQGAPEALPGQTATWHLLPGTREMSNSIQPQHKGQLWWQPTGRALTTALCMGKMSEGEGTRPDALHQERTFQWSSHISQMFKVLHQNTWKTTFRLEIKRYSFAANTVWFCATHSMEQGAAFHWVWTRESAATTNVILNISLKNLKLVQTS